MADVASSSRASGEALPRIDSPAAKLESRRGLWASLGAIGAALLASLCCIGPLMFVTLGVGAGLASTFEPVRPLFTGLTIGLLAVGFYIAYGKKPPADLACDPDGTCTFPRNRARDRVLLWIAAVLAVVLLTFPTWSTLLL